MCRNNLQAGPAVRCLADARPEKSRSIRRADGVPSRRKVTDEGKVEFRNVQF
jgi:hypothetical protein